MKRLTTPTRIALAGLLTALILSACSLPVPGQSGANPFRTVPEADLPPPDFNTPPAFAFPPAEEVSRRTTEAQLERFDFVWTTIYENYAFHDYNGVDWVEIHDEYKEQIEAGMTNETFHDALAAMVAELGDPETAYLTPQQIYDQTVAAQLAQNQPEPGYIGVTVGVPDDRRDTIAIKTVMRSSSAEREGVLPHDSIIAIEGTPIPEGVGAEILNQIRGPEGSTVDLTLQSPGESPREVTLTRGPLTSEDGVLFKPLGRVGYIFVPAVREIGDLIDDQVADAFRRMRNENNVEALVLDLRICSPPAASAWPIDSMIGLFTYGPAYELFNVAEVRPISVPGKDIEGSQTIPLVIMTSYDTLGECELFAGVLQAQGRAIIVGGQTQGRINAVSSSNVFDDPMRTNEDALLFMSAAGFRSLQGQVWNRAGVTPDVEVDLLWEEVSPDNDPQLDAAIEAVLSRLN